MRHSGFSLIELAVVLVIVGLLLGSGLAAMTARTEQARRAEQREQFESIRAALHGFAMAHGRLPCADTDYPDGDSADHGTANYDDTAGACEDGAERGALPWVTLGLGRRDAWGNVLYYEVTAHPTADPPVVDHADDPGSDPASFGLGDEGHLDVDDSSEDGDPIAEAVPAVVVSFGPQSDQVWAGTGIPCGSPTGFSEDEQENCDADQTFVDAGYRPANSPAGRFDDQLMWLSNSVLQARMVDALP